MSKLLLEEHPLVILPKLATIIGLNEAIFIQQLHYWITKSENIVKGLKWSYNSYEKLQEQFPFFSLKTIQRIIKNLKDKKLILVEKLSSDRRDKTNWYTINYDNFNDLMNETKETNAQSQDDLVHKDKMTLCTETDCPDVIVKSLTETTTETTAETTTEKKEKEKDTLEVVQAEIIEEQSKSFFNQKLFNEYLDFRKENKLPTSSTVIFQLTNRLAEFSRKGFNPDEIISTALMNGWKTFFEPRQQKQNASFVEQERQRTSNIVDTVSSGFNPFNPELYKQQHKGQINENL